MRDDDEALQTFVADRYPRLRRSAFLMSGNWGSAAEQARTTLARLVTRADRVRMVDVDGYAWSDLMRGCQHRPGRRDHIDVASHDADTSRVLVALRELTPQCRAVLVLRHFNGFTVERTADLLGMPDDLVEAYAATGVGALEVQLAGTTPPVEPARHASSAPPAAGTRRTTAARHAADPGPGPDR